MTTNRKFQIGVMGSSYDLNPSKKVKKVAFEIGKKIAESNGVLIFGAEKDYNSLSTLACQGAKKAGGITVGVTYGSGLVTYDPSFTDIVIATGLLRGGGRETSLVLSCDAIVCIGGGSGTLTEIAIAYQAGIPVIVLQNTGGWSEKLANSYLDERKKLKCISANNAKDAVSYAIREAKFRNS